VFAQKRFHKLSQSGIFGIRAFELETTLCTPDTTHLMRAALPSDTQLKLKVPRDALRLIDFYKVGDHEEAPCSELTM
jgi:hypothetical protein